MAVCHQSRCIRKKMITPTSIAQSAMRSSVESRKAPNSVPPVVSAAIEPSNESASTSRVRTTAPPNSHPVTPVAMATTMVPTAPITVTALAVSPMAINALAIGSMSFLNGARRCSSMCYFLLDEKMRNGAQTSCRDSCAVSRFMVACDLLPPVSLSRRGRP